MRVCTTHALEPLSTHLRASLYAGVHMTMEVTGDGNAGGCALRKRPRRLPSPTKS